MYEYCIDILCKNLYHLWKKTDSKPIVYQHWCNILKNPAAKKYIYSDKVGGIYNYKGKSQMPAGNKQFHGRLWHFYF